MRFLRSATWALLGLALLAPASRAEVKQAAPDACLVVQGVQVAATPRAVYDALGEIGRWWSRPHTWFGEPRNLSLELRAGGCFCERTADASAEHGRVILANPGETLRLQAALGPLQEMAVTGVLTFALEAANGGTVLTATYRISGDQAHALDKIAAAVDGVIGEQVRRLKRFVETGTPE